MHGHADFEDTYLASPRRQPMPRVARRRRRSISPALTWALIVAVGFTLVVGLGRLHLG